MFTKKNVFLLIVFLLVCINAFSNDTGKTRMAILPFFIKGKLDTNLVNLFYNNLVGSMEDTKNYSIIDKTSVDQIFDVLKIQKNSELSDKNAIDVGTSIRASVVVVGTIAFFDGSYFVSIRGIDTNSGNEIFKENELVTGDTNLLKLADNFAKSISKSNKKSETSLGPYDNKNYSGNEAEKYMKISRTAKIIGNVGVGGFIPSLVFVFVGSIITGVGSYLFLNQLDYDDWGFPTHNTDYYNMYLAGLGLIGAFVPLSVIFLVLLIVGNAVSYVFNKKARRISMYIENRQSICVANSLYENNHFQANPSVGIKFSF